MKGFTPSAKQLGQIKGHQFLPQHGFTGSAGIASVRPHTRNPPKKRVGPPPGLAKAAPSPMMDGDADDAPGGQAPMAKGGQAKGHSTGCTCPMCYGGRMRKGGKVLKKAEGGLIGHHNNPHKQSESPDWSDYKKGGQAKGGKLHLNIKEGALRKTLGVSGDKKIPAEKLKAATHSSNPLTKKRAVLAENMRSWNHK